MAERWISVLICCHILPLSLHSVVEVNADTFVQHGRNGLPTASLKLTVSTSATQNVARRGTFLMIVAEIMGESTWKFLFAVKET